MRVRVHFFIYLPDWMHSYRSITVQPRCKLFHQKMNITGTRWYVATDVNLSPSKMSALDRVHVSQYPSMNFQNILYRDGPDTVEIFNKTSLVFGRQIIGE